MGGPRARPGEAMTRAKLAAIRLLDWIDDALNHPSMRLCAWIVMHPWWGEDNESHRGGR